MALEDADQIRRELAQQVTGRRALERANDAIHGLVEAAVARRQPRVLQCFRSPDREEAGNVQLRVTVIALREGGATHRMDETLPHAAAVHREITRVLAKKRRKKKCA